MKPTMDNKGVIKKEKKIVSEVLGVGVERIEAIDESWQVRAYVVDDGKFVFKFPKNDQTQFENEIRVLECINGLRKDINLQKVGWVREDNSYIGLHGVVGKRLDTVKLNDDMRQSLGKQLGRFLRKLHSVKWEGEPIWTVSHEIEKTHKAYDRERFKEYGFTDAELRKIEYLVYDYMPKKLNALGTKYVFSHGDFWEQNLFVDQNGKAGVIDFNYSGNFEESVDFTGIDDNGLFQAVLDNYGADEALREKIRIRRLVAYVEPIGVIHTKSDFCQKDIDKLESMITGVKATLKTVEVKK